MADLKPFWDLFALGDGVFVEMYEVVKVLCGLDKTDPKYLNLYLNWLKHILQKAPLEVVKAAHDASFKSVISIVLQSDDTSELQVSEYWLS